MASYLDNLKTARDNVAANLAAITASPKPSYSVDGQSFSWSQLYDSYTKSLADLNEQINAAEPFEFQSQGYSP